MFPIWISRRLSSCCGRWQKQRLRIRWIMGIRYLRSFLPQQAPNVPDVLALPHRQSEPDQHAEADEVEDHVWMARVVTLKVDAAVVDIDSYDGQQDLYECEDDDKHATYHKTIIIQDLPGCWSAVDCRIHLRGRKQHPWHDNLQRACQKLQRHEFLNQHAIYL